MYKIALDKRIKSEAKGKSVISTERFCLNSMKSYSFFFKVPKYTLKNIFNNSHNIFKTNVTFAFYIISFLTVAQMRKLRDFSIDNKILSFSNHGNTGI